MEEHDVLVVGGSFAGLNFAKVAADNNLDVLVVDKKDKLHKNKTTGLVTRELVEELLPKDTLSNEIQRLNIYAPNGKGFILDVKKNLVFLSNPKELLKWLKRRAKESGAEIKTNRKVKGFGENRIVKTEKEKIKPRYVIGADGPISVVADHFGLAQNKRFLLGYEEAYKGVKGLNPKEMHAFLDNDIAPGYGAWIAPRGEQTLIGLAGYKDHFNPKRAFKEFKKKAKGLFDFSESKKVKSKSGLIPINGPLSNVVSREALLVGDSAGLTHALTSEGIKPAIEFSTKAARAVTNYLFYNNYKNLRRYEKACKSDGQIRLNYLLRRIYDNLCTNNDILNEFVEMYKERKEVIRLFSLIPGNKSEFLREGTLEILRKPKWVSLIGKGLLNNLKEHISSGD